MYLNLVNIIEDCILFISIVFNDFIAIVRIPIFVYYLYSRCVLKTFEIVKDNYILNKILEFQYL